MDTQRIIALIVFSASALFLWEAWQKHNRPAAPVNAPAVTQAGNVAPPTVAPKSGAAATVPVPATPASSSTAPAGAVAPTAVPASTARVTIDTDLLRVSLDAASADIRTVTLRKHKAAGGKEGEFVLMQDKVGAYFITQTGLLDHNLPNHTANWSLVGDKSGGNLDLGSNEKLEVTFTNADTPGVTAFKTYTFRRGAYMVDVRYDIKNESGAAISPRAYFQFLRDANPPEGESAGNNPFTGIATFTGPAVFTEAKKFQKVAFSDIDKKKVEYPKASEDGWLAMIQHYFVSAWLPQAGAKREFFTNKVTDSLYAAGVILPVATVAPGAAGSITMPLYLGPQDQEKLKSIAPGLDLVVDYGFLHILAYPMFVVLSWIHGFVGNWGWTIIIFTILIKVVFFPLNQKAGKSMAQMKALAPKIEAMKARYGDDKLKMNQAMMELYRGEKVNPLGGCLPILVQMPFFIALYWVLLSAVELRHAPWIGWITDLSTPDPYYVLPLIMGISMFVQTKLNPAPADPVQAKVMTIMPIVFSIMFFFFPAGLVLYWTMQNLLGIAQQWYINKTFTPAPVVKTAKR
jgi:YidC/Oxa1 family membrane protein insertase